jgi:LPS O-antigen subunit length determinant protein (WzzB/FepE family)
MEQDQTNQNYPVKNDSIDLKELINLLWGGKKPIMLITFVCAFCSIFYALSLTNYYKSEAVLTLASGSSEMSTLSAFSGIASMAGIRMPSTGGGDKGEIIVNTILSRAFLKHLLTFEDILPSIIAPKSYDSQSKKLVFDPNIYDVSNKTWMSKDDKGQQIKPSYLEAYDVYMKQMAMNYNDRIGIISISIEHISPIFAKDFLDLIIREADTLIRQKDLQQSSDALDYLVSEISKTSLIEMKSSMNQLIQSQLETQMMAKIGTDYAVRIIEPPFIPEKKFKPSRFFIFLFGTMLGLVLGILWILINHYYALGTIKQT